MDEGQLKALVQELLQEVSAVVPTCMPCFLLSQSVTHHRPSAILRMWTQVQGLKQQLVDVQVLHQQLCLLCCRHAAVPYCSRLGFTMHNLSCRQTYQTDLMTLMKGCWTSALRCACRHGAAAWPPSCSCLWLAATQAVLQQAPEVRGSVSRLQETGVKAVTI